MESESLVCACAGVITLLIMGRVQFNLAAAGAVSKASNPVSERLLSTLIQQASGTEWTSMN